MSAAGFRDWHDAWRTVLHEVALFGLGRDRPQACPHAHAYGRLWRCPIHQRVLLCDGCFAEHVDDCRRVRRVCMRCGGEATGLHFRDAPPEQVTVGNWTGQQVWRAVPLCGGTSCGPLAEYVENDRAGALTELADWMRRNPVMALLTTEQYRGVAKFVCGQHPQYGIHPTVEAVRGACRSMHELSAGCGCCGVPGSVAVAERGAELWVPEDQPLRARFEGSTTRLSRVHGLVTVDCMTRVCSDCAWMWSDQERPMRLGLVAAAG